MGKIDEDMLKMCRFQGEVFEQSLTATKCSSPIFLRRFMLSDVAARMDKQGFLNEAVTQATVLEEINREFGTTNYGQTKYSREEMYWMGYLYRYWCCLKELNSKGLYKIVKPSELQKLYYPYHSLDPAQAIERISEAKGMQETDYVAQGVALLRKLKHTDSVK